MSSELWVGWLGSWVRGRQKLVADGHLLVVRILGKDVPGPAWTPVPLPKSAWTQWGTQRADLSVKRPLHSAEGKSRGELEYPRTDGHLSEAVASEMPDWKVISDSNSLP